MLYKMCRPIATRNVQYDVFYGEMSKMSRELDPDGTFGRLRQARIDAGYETATDAARAFGWNENTYRSHENGERGLRFSVLSRYATALRVSAGWLISGRDDLKRAETTLPLSGYIAQSGLIAGFKLDRQIGVVQLTLATFPSQNHYAFAVKTRDLLPQYFYGDIVVCQRSPIDLFAVCRKHYAARQTPASVEAIFDFDGTDPVLQTAFMNADGESAILQRFGHPPQMIDKTVEVLPVHTVFRSWAAVTMEDVINHHTVEIIP